MRGATERFNIMILGFIFTLMVLSCGEEQNRNKSNSSMAKEEQKPMGVTGRVDRLEPIESDQLPNRKVDVWLPPGYEDSERAYPVIYAHDGQNLFDPATSYIGVDWALDETMTELITSRKIKPAIVVGIWNTENRTNEYMPEKAAEMLESQVTSQSVEDEEHFQPVSDAYLAYIVEELKPAIDRTYRTRPERNHTYLLGSSMGGLISLYGVCEYPDVFGGAACLSTHWPAGDGIVLEYLKAHLPKPGAHRFYFDYGTETLDADYEPYQLRADRIMKEAGYVQGEDWLTLKFEGDEHSERSWRQRVHIPLEFLLGTPGDSTASQ